MRLPEICVTSFWLGIISTGFSLCSNVHHMTRAAQVIEKQFAKYPVVSRGASKRNKVL